MRQLKIDSTKVKQKLLRFIRNQTKQAGFTKVVVGLSGGLDSSLVLYLCCQALGKDNVFALILPYKITTSETINCAKLIARKYQVKTRFIDITEQIDIYFKDFPQANKTPPLDPSFKGIRRVYPCGLKELGGSIPVDKTPPLKGIGGSILVDKIRRGNKMARERMSILYDQSKDLDALVVGTGNKTEVLLGYGTIYGDMACAFNPLGNLYKTQLRQLAKNVGIPRDIIQKAPSAGLWPGQTDEKELGVTYAKVDRLLYYLVDKKFSDKKLIRLGFKKSLIEKVKKRIAENAFKRRMPPIAKI